METVNFYRLFYFFTMADKLSGFFLLFALVTTGLTLLFGGIVLFNDGMTTNGYGTKETPPTVALWYRNAQYIARVSLIACPLLWLARVATPTKKEAVIIVAGGYLGNFIQSDSNARKLPADITNFLRVQINQAAADTDLKTLLGPSKEEMRRDSLLRLSKEELVKRVME